MHKSGAVGVRAGNFAVVVDAARLRGYCAGEIEGHGAAAHADKSMQVAGLVEKAANDVDAAIVEAAANNRIEP